MKLRNLLLAATMVLAVPVAAKAQPVNGLYVGVGAGFNYMQDWDVKSSHGPIAAGSKIPGAGGPAGVISLGYGLGNGLRIELEGNYRQSDRRSVLGGGGGPIQTYGVMANALYDFDIGTPWLYPYIGVGAGYEETHVDAISGYPGGVYTSVGGQKGSFAAQGIIGASIPMAGAPGLSFTAEYRFMADLQHESFDGYAGAAPVSLRMGNQYNHSILIGLRYAFGVTPPPPAPAPAAAAAPAPAPARTYLVFFDWDKSDLTARARQIIAEAAQASTHVSLTKIVVSGYTDRSGTVAYNQVLSVKRANAVAAELVKDGVNRNEISAAGYGELNPLVPTADGVREPQNRRVQIVLQ